MGGRCDLGKGGRHGVADSGTLRDGGVALWGRKMGLLTGNGAVVAVGVLVGGGVLHLD